MIEIIWITKEEAKDFFPEKNDQLPRELEFIFPLWCTSDNERKIEDCNKSFR